MKKLIIIPARMGSTRLPNKPLADINGQPMIVHVLNKAKLTGYDVLVACSEKEVFDVVTDNGGLAIMTDPDLPSGTDRIFQAYEKSGKDHELIINLQGDLPLIDAELIKELASFAENSNFDIITSVAEIKDEAEINNPNVVKPVISWNDKNTGKALYFSRATIPHGEGMLYHHVGIYIYRSGSLKKFVQFKPSPLEKREKLEQLRALENNMNIGVMLTDKVPLGVDTEQDLEKVRKILS
jgi:3-deoxy-manno-octulosonate cytidylyltransferase (CMP-KDO synthetase)